MEPTKVYKSLVYVAFNVIKNERLRYELYSKENFKDQLLALINNMYALEKYHKQDLNGKQWGPIFARALVKTTNKKQEFSIPSGKTVDEIYANYATFVSFTSTTYEIGRNVLVEEIVNFSPEEVTADAELIEDVIKKYRELEIAKEQAQQQAASPQNQTASSYTQTNDNSNAQTSNFGAQSNNFMGGNNNPFVRATGLNPMQNPRFYPYLTKPRWMPILKYTLAATTIAASLILIITMSIMMSIKINFGPNNDINNPFGRALFGDAWNGDWNSFLTDDAKKQYGSFPLVWPMIATSAGSIISVIFYALPAIYMGYVVFRQPKSLRDKYRLSPFPVIFMFIFFILALINLIGVMSPHQLANSFRQNFSLLFREDANPNHQAFWSVMMQHYGTEIWVICSFSIIGVVLIGVTIIMAISLLVVNPRVDHSKLQRASMEYERAMGAMIQGMSYEMDSSIFDDEDINMRQPSKFRIWIIKRFKKRDKGSKSTSQTTAL